MNIKKRNLYLFRLFLVSIVLKAISLYKISFILGSQTAFFNGSSISVPLVGFFAGSFGSVLLFVLRLSNWYLFTSGSLHLLAFVIPGFCASLYWTTKSSLVRFWLPLLCMAAFMVHPVGHLAFVYSFYWIIPLVLYFLKQENIWTCAIGSTFIAHAVGSVIWLYTLPTTASMWMLLLPVVAVERLLCVAAMVGICYSSCLADQFLHALDARIQAVLQQRRQI